jgi:hypothetical protein
VSEKAKQPYQELDKQQTAEFVRGACRYVAELIRRQHGSRSLPGPGSKFWVESEQDLIVHQVRRYVDTNMPGLLVQKSLILAVWRSIFISEVNR